MSNPISGHVRSLNLALQPGQLLKNLCDLCSSCSRIHAAFLRTEFGRVPSQIHSSLSVGKVGLGAVGTCNVEVVAPDEQLHEGTFFRSVHDKGGTLLAKLILQVLHDHKGLKDRVATSCNKSRHFFKRVHSRKFLRLQICIGYHLRVDCVCKSLESVPEADTSRIVAVLHVEEGVLWRVAVLKTDDRPTFQTNPILAVFRCVWVLKRSMHYEARAIFLLIVDVEEEGFVLGHLWVIEPFVILSMLG